MPTDDPGFPGKPALPAALRGALWMTGAAACFATINGIVRFVADEIHPLELVFFRGAFGLLFLLPWLFHRGVGVLRTEQFGLYAVRGVLALATIAVWFTALTLLPLAEAVTLSFTVPLFGTLTAVLFLGERVSPHRWAATAIGLLGVLIVMRPGIETLRPAALLVLLSSALIALTVIIIKKLSEKDSASTIVAYQMLLLTPLSLIPALFVWETPASETWPWLVAIGGLGTLGHVALTRSLAAAEASTVVPFDYARLPFTALIGFLVFAETPDAWTWVGAAVIVTSSVYVARMAARQRPLVEPAPEAMESTGAEPPHEEPPRGDKG